MATFLDRFLACAERWPSNVAVELQRPDQVESYSYAELRRMAEAVAAWLLERGMPCGACVAILADNHPRWVVAYLGIIAAGGTAVPLDTNYHAQQVAKLVADSQSWLLISDQQHLEIAEEAVRGSRASILLTQLTPGAIDEQPEGSGERTQQRRYVDFDQLFLRPSHEFRPVPRAPDDLVSLLYTSGTTADPKGVMLTHANLLAEAEAMLAWAHIGPEDTILGVLPLFHVLSQMANLLLPLVAGARAVFLSTLNTSELLRALEARRVTAFAVVPQFFYLIHERIFKELGAKGRAVRTLYPLLMRFNRGSRRFGLNLGRVLFRPVHHLFGRHMRYLVTAGSRFDPKIAEDFYMFGIDILQAYGLTESSGGAFANPPGESVIGSVGKALKGVEAKIVKAKIVDAPATLDPGPETGEILLRGPIVMKGYWNRPDATAEALNDGWLATGDLGYFDKQGNLFITGRKKEVIILGNGKNIYPEEIEAHYLASPFIQEICVVGVEDGGGSDRLHAVIVPSFDALRERKVVNAKEVIRFDVESLSAKLPSTKRIASYEIWQQGLPRTSTRKLKRFAIEQQVRANNTTGGEERPDPAKPYTEDEKTWLAQESVQRALKIIATYSARPRPIHPSDNLELDLGLDSMRRVELLVALEQELGLHIEESRASDLYTVRDLLDAAREANPPEKQSVIRQLAGWGAVLEEQPLDPQVFWITKPRPILDRVLLVFIRLIKFAWRSVSRLEVDGIENIPRQGAFLLCSNHQSFLDPFPLLAVLPFWALKRMFAVGTSEIFGAGVMRQFARLMRTVVVDPDANLIPAMRAGAFGLRQQMALLMYPEGERTIDGTPKIFKKGAAILAIHLQVPIVPVAIDGFYEAWPRGKRFQRFAPLKIRIGEAMLPPPASQAGEAGYAQLTAELKDRIFTMWNQLHSPRTSPIP
ncbi:MAG: AMP-binding protein [Acidobacteria bacterium]|nr:AMP-binding protein [Acidobacteriota bacterium]